MSNSFISNFIKKPPALFPWVALFHVAMLCFCIFNAVGEPSSTILWIDVAWMVLYTISWLFVCYMKKWAGFVYIALALLNLTLYFLFQNDPVKQDYVSSLFLIDILFTLFILAYYKKFE